jgi:hypothetical protein
MFETQRLMLKHPLAALLAIGLAAGCTENRGHDDAGTPPPDADAALQARIAHAVRSIESDTCFAQPDTSQCEWAEYEIGPAQFHMAASTGEAILVIDGLDAGEYPELVRYRNRILGFYRIDGESIVSQVLSVRLPRRLGDVLTAFAGPEFIPARVLTPISQAMRTTYAALGSLSTPGHGGVVLGHLVDLVPEQPLVLLDMTHLFEVPPVLCQRPDDAAALDAATAHVAAVAAALRDVIAAHHVRFINASFGTTTATLAEQWARQCGQPVPGSARLRQLVHVYDPIYDLLFHSDGVITAHAAAALGDPADFPFDQASPRYANQVRVGYFSSTRSGLDDAGRGTVHKADQYPPEGDADVFLNWGCEGLGVCADLHYQLALFGLTVGTVPIMSTSYVTPLAVARLVNLRYAGHAGEPMSDALIQTLEHELTPALCGAGGAEPCVYQDPIAHHQLEVDRLFGAAPP